jgi:hypothetical protein
MHSLFYQLPNYNLFTHHVIYLYGETPLVNCGPWSILLHILLSTASTIYFPQAFFIFLLQTNILFHTICLILCFQQTSEIYNLTAGAKYLGCVVCRFHVAAGTGSQFATTFGSGFFLLLVD